MFVTDRWNPHDVIMTSAWRHPLTSGSRVSVSLTCGPGQSVNVDRSTVNTGRASTRPGTGRAWPATWCSLVRPRRPCGLLLGLGPRNRFMVDHPSAVHEPHTESMVDSVHPPFLSPSALCVGCTTPPFLLLYFYRTVAWCPSTASSPNWRLQWC